MLDLSTLLYDILKHLIGGMALIALTFLISFCIKGRRLMLYRRLFHEAKVHGLHRYNGWNECSKMIAERIGTSKEVAIIEIKGKTLTANPDPYRTSLQSRASFHKNTRVLLQSPRSNHVNESVSKAFHWPALQQYRQDLVYSIQILMCLMKVPSDNSFKIALYDTEPLLRLFMFDDEIFVGLYSIEQADQPPETWEVWRLTRRSDLHGLGWLIERYFESLWEESVPAENMLTTPDQVTCENLMKVLVK